MIAEAIKAVNPAKIAVPASIASIDTTRPPCVTGTMSPNPTPVIVVTVKYNESNQLVTFGLASCSIQRNSVAMAQIIEAEQLKRNTAPGPISLSMSAPAYAFMNP